MRTTVRLFGIVSLALGSSVAWPQAEYDAQRGLERHGPQGAVPGGRAPVLHESTSEAARSFQERYPGAEFGFRAGSAFPTLVRIPRADEPGPGAGAVTSATAAAAALAFLAAEAELLGLAEPPVSVAPGRTHQLDGATVVHLEQRHQDLPVLGRGITVLVDSLGQIAAFLPRLERDIPTLPGPRLEETDAVAIALARLAGSPALPPVEPASGRLAVARVGKRHRVVWDLRLGTAIGPYRVLVDAASGELIGAGSLLQTLNCAPRPRGDAYPESPVKGPAAEVELGDLDCGGVFLTGEFVRTFDWVGSNPFTYDPIFELGLRGSKTGSGTVFDATSPPALAQVTIFHHATRFHAWFNRLGFRGLDRPFPTVANALDCFGEVPCENAYFHPLYEYATGLGILVFGVGPGVNFGLEADVICHEYTHAVVAATADLGSNFFDPFVFYSLALNEAFADYFSSTFVGDPMVGEYIGRSFGRVPLRTLDNDLHWPEGIDPWSFHDTGQIWGGALWSIRQALSQGGADPAGLALADRLAYTALVALESNADFLDAAEAVSAAATALRLTPAQSVTVKDLLSARGLLSAPDRPAAEVQRVTTPAEVAGEVPALTAGSLRLHHVQYEIVVPNHGSRLVVELEGGGNLDLYVRYKSPVTPGLNSVTATARSEGPTAVERIELLRDGAPALSPGSWFVAIANRSAAVGTYKVKLSLETTSFDEIITLAAGVPSSASAPPGPGLSPTQFAFHVAEAADRRLSLRLTGDRDGDLFVRLGSPVELGVEGQIVADVALRSPATTEELALEAWSVPSLMAGTYYIAVWNAAAESLQHSVEARLDPAPPAPLQEIAVASGQQVVGAAAGASPGTSRLGEIQYTIDVTRDGARLVAALRTGADLGLSLRRDQPVLPGALGLVRDHSSDLPGPGDETAVVDLFSTPPLAAGRYYVAVDNHEAAAAAFDLTISVQAVPPAANVQPLANGTWITVNVEAATAAEPARLAATQYRLSVSARSPGLDVLTNPLGPGNVDLYLRRERPVQMIDGRIVADHHAESAIGAESIAVFQRDLIAGTYFVALVNRERTAVSLDLIAVHEGDLPLTVLVEKDDLFEGAISAAPNPPTGCRLSLDQFSVEVPANALRLEVLVTPLTGGTLQVLGRFGGRIVIDQGAAIFDQEFSTAQGPIVYSGLDLQPGFYYFTIANCEGREQRYEFSMRLTVPGAPEAGLPNGEIQLATLEGVVPGASGRLHATQFTFSVGQGIGEVVVSAWGGECALEDVDLYINQGGRVTWQEGDVTNAAWQAATRGGGAETILLNASSVPPLAPGDFYVAAVNREASRVPLRIVGAGLPARSIALEDGVERTDTAPTSGQAGAGVLKREQYRIQVPEGATQLDCNLRPTGNPALDIDLHLRYATPIRIGGDGTTVADVRSEAAGTGVERTALPTGAECLRPGTYFLAIGNFEATQVPFRLKAEVTGGGPRIVRGDADEDGQLSLTDAIATLSFLFRGGAPVCEASADVDASGQLDLSDAIYLLSFLFRGGPPPAAPYPDCGPAPTAATAGCSGAACP